jgi:hypothetical protein
MVMLCSCACEQAPSGGNENPVAEGAIIYPKDMDSNSRSRVAMIHLGLTFEEVARIIPIYTNGLQKEEHGGIWYNAPAGTNWIVELRFENPLRQPDLQKRKLNCPPLIRDRGPNQASW